MNTPWKPWHEVVALREDIKTGELSLATFAADLYDVVVQKGHRPIYEDPDRFFALTYPTHNLRELVKGTALRLAGESDKACRNLYVNYGGGKTHTLITLRHLFHDPDSLPDLPAVNEFRAYIEFEPPKARIAALCFDKIDTEMGVETLAPDGTARTLKHPWSILAYQLAGADGLRAIHADGDDQERESPPAEPLMVDLLAWPQKDGLATLILLDEILMYLRNKVEMEGAWRGRMKSFFQYLTQAAVKVDRCAMVVSLLASDPSRHDELGQKLLKDAEDVFGRLKEEEASPVDKDDVAEVLRRRFFEPASISDINTFRQHVAPVINNIATLDEQIKKERGTVEKRYRDSFPFHPELTEALYTRWTQLEGFQRTRGILRIFAMALRDAEKWDKSPLIGANVFLNELGKNDLAGAVRELCSAASIEGGEGRTQQWVPILEGELAKAREIQSEMTGLDHREIEQAVIAVFLSSQPIGQKATTSELLVFLGTTQPDKIGLEKALRRWTELSWFLDELDVQSAEANADGTEQLPRTWRLGNRPNLRQMHHDACSNRVLPEHVEAQLLDMTENLRPLVEGASAAGAKVHRLPGRPSDIQDDGEFHYAVLGPGAASDSGKPSAEAKRFISETTAPDHPRVYRNAVVLAVPSRDGLDGARNRVREHLGWREVREQLKDQTIDPIRQQVLTSEESAAQKRVPDAIRQAYSVVVTVDTNNEVQAFKVAVGEESLFATIKADRRARIQDIAVNSEAMMPGGPYDLWREGEISRRVKDLTGAFAQNSKLPKMLRRKAVLDTVIQGVQQGIWVAQAMRPDRSVRTFWRMLIDDTALQDPGLEVLLPEAAKLTELAPGLLAYQELPGLWTGEEITLEDINRYFAGGHTATVPKENYEDTVTIPECEPTAIKNAVGKAVEEGILWLINGPASIFGEQIPAGVLAAAAKLQPPPDPIAVNDMTVEMIPEAWKEGKTTAFAILTALSGERGKPLPWPFVRDAISDAIKAQWIERADDGIPWPYELEQAKHVILQKPADRGQAERPQPKPGGLLTAEADLTVERIQDLADQIPALAEIAVEHDLKFHLRVEFGGETPPSADDIDRVSAILAKVSEELKLG